MNKAVLLISTLLVAPVQAEKPPEVANSTGFVTIGWVFARSKEDLYDMWAAHSDNVKLKGSVAKFLDWSNVSRIVVIYNAWHLPVTKKDIRIQHIEDNLKEATFGDRFKGANPGGTYVLLLQYRDGDREVLLSFKDGVFLVESRKGIGVVDIRNTH